jgi:predicted dehydrogenase
VIATPTGTHLEVIEKVKSELKPKAIILEKPCGVDSTEVRAIKEIAGNTTIAVNYIRRYDPMIQAVQRELAGKKIFSANVKYGRGLVRDGSHGIDFMNWFFGKCQDFKILYCKIYNDYSINDLTCSAYGEWENCPSVTFQAVDGRVCDVFEIEIMSELGCHWFLNHGNDIYFRRIEDERMYGNYKALSSSVNVTRTCLGTDLLMLYDNVIANIEGREKLLCTIDDAIAVHKVIEGGKV